MTLFYSYGPGGEAKSSNIDPLEIYTPLINSEEVHECVDPVGQYLASQAIIKASNVSHPEKNYQYANMHTPSNKQRQLSHDSHDLYTHRSASFLEANTWCPDPEHIRHLHTLHSVLPHILPARKLNARNGPTLDIVEGYSGHVFYRAAPKKMLVLFLGRDVVSKFLQTVEREDNKRWKGLPTRQNLVLPQKIASHTAVKVLMTWMTRACTYTTVDTMEQLRVPNNLFAACSLAQTLELLGLHNDACRVDSIIAQQLIKRPIYVIELEALWQCLGENSRYVYGSTKAYSFSRESGLRKVSGDLQDLSVRNPRLYARICDPQLNETHKPEFGRRWFEGIGSRASECNAMLLKNKSMIHHRLRFQMSMVESTHSI